MNFDESRCQHEWDHRWRADGARYGYSTGHQSRSTWKEKCSKCEQGRKMEHVSDAFRGVETLTQVGPHIR